MITLIENIQYLQAVSPAKLKLAKPNYAIGTTSESACKCKKCLSSK